MIKVIFNIIGVIISLIFLIGGGGGIVLIGNCAVNVLEELVKINETIAMGICGIIYGWIISVIGYHVVMHLIRD